MHAWLLAGPWLCATTSFTFSLRFGLKQESKPTVKMKKSSMNMAPNGRMPAINVLSHSQHGTNVHYITSELFIVA